MSKPLNCITVEEARELRNNWVQTRAVYIENRLGSPDIHEFLFSVEELQQYLDYVKAGTEKETPGIRIYFAAYSDNKSDKATVFLAPTLGITAESKNNYDLQPLNRSVQGWPPRNY